MRTYLVTFNNYKGYAIVQAENMQQAYNLFRQRSHFTIDSIELIVENVFFIVV